MRNGQGRWFWGWRRVELALQSVVFGVLPLSWRLRGSGIRIRVKNSADWTIYNDIFVDGEYDEPIGDALRGRPVDRPVVMLDLGANVGFFAKRALHLAAELAVPRHALRIICVEGSPSVFRRLRARMQEDGPWADATELVHGMVGAERSGHGRMRQLWFHGMNHALRDKSWGGRTVPYVDLDAVCADLPRIDLLKCDIEGGEQDFFETYTTLLGRVDRLVLEMHEDLCDRGRCVEALGDAGFDGYRRLWGAPGRPLEYFWRQHGCARESGRQS